MSNQLRGKFFLEDRLVAGKISIAGSRIEAIELMEPEQDHPLIVPSFVDVHVHGGGGCDFADGEVDGALEVARVHAAHGTGAMIASIVSSSEEETIAAIESVGKAREANDPNAASIVGVHLEGPWIAEERAGAHAHDRLRLPGERELENWRRAAGEMPIYVTLAPELPGALPLISRFSDTVSFAIGHTECDYATALDAISRGARAFTHLFNAMRPLHHRAPGPVGAALISEATLMEIIADGVHVQPVVIQIVARLGASRCILVTDAMRAAGSGDGDWKLGSLDVRVRNGEARLDNGALAGSVLTMDVALRNMVELAGLPLDLVVPMATSIPAGFASLARKGRVSPGFDADLLVLDEKLVIRDAILRGRRIS
ncbi:MAG: N-acetylglucosamine-6-phosphate deacetylase [Acidobacteria bacterium]|nr:N-acetylglucosamine-6-phosphate deacetylase [Acidobacteriota bacterium]